jgi:hypothetical protein
LRNKKKRREKLVPGKNVPFHRLRFVLPWKKQTAGRSAKSYHELGWKIQVHHNTLKKYLTKMGVYRKAKKSAPSKLQQNYSITSTIRHQSWRKLFSAKSIYKCLMDDDESYITVDGSEW